MRPSDSWSKARVTAGIAIVTAACWLIVDLFGLDLWAAIWGGFIPARFGLTDDGSMAPFWLTPLTATLVHGGIIHLAFNLLILVFCGRRVENVLGPVSLAVCLGAPCDVTAATDLMTSEGITAAPFNRYSCGVPNTPS